MRPSEAAMTLVSCTESAQKVCARIDELTGGSTPDTKVIQRAGIELYLEIKQAVEQMKTVAEAGFNVSDTARQLKAAGDRLATEIFDVKEGESA